MRRLLGEAKLRALSWRRRETPWRYFPPLSLAEEAGVVDAPVVTTVPKKEEPFDNLAADVAAMIASILLHLLAHSVFLGSRRENNLCFTTKTPQWSMGHYFFTSFLSPYLSYNNTHVQEWLQLLLLGIFAAFFFVCCVLTRHPKDLSSPITQHACTYDEDTTAAAGSKIETPLFITFMQGVLCKKSISSYIRSWVPLSWDFICKSVKFQFSKSSGKYRVCGNSYWIALVYGLIIACCPRQAFVIIF